MQIYQRANFPLRYILTLTYIVNLENNSPSTHTLITRLRILTKVLLPTFTWKEAWMHGGTANPRMLAQRALINPPDQVGFNRSAIYDFYCRGHG